MRIKGQISIEFLIIVLALILYISAWFVVAKDIILKTQYIVEGWKNKIKGEEIQRSINMMCMGAGRISIEGEEVMVVEGHGEYVSVNGKPLPVNCRVRGSVRGKKVVVEKGEGGVIIHE
ncbi:MAG: hypothetical protein ACTSVF_05160 [Candidatus Asgardarchaeia archaeon]